MKLLKLSAIIFLAVISLKAQSLPDSCKYSRAWYDVSVLKDYPLLKTLPKGVSIIADTASKPVNFVSQNEEYRRVLGSGHFNKDKTWEEIITTYKIFKNSEIDSSEKNTLGLFKEADRINFKNNSRDFIVWIVNNSTDTIGIPAQDGSIMAIKEAKDEKGNWRPIEYWAYSGCGDSYIDVLIAPGKAVQFPISRSDGDFKTKARLKIIGKNQFIYSNEFSENIPSCLLKNPIPKNKANFDDFFTKFKKVRTMSFPGYGNVYHRF